MRGTIIFQGNNDHTKVRTIQAETEIWHKTNNNQFIDFRCQETGKDRRVKQVGVRETGIPFSTLQRRIKKKKFSTPTLGRHATFTQEQENVLSERILLLSNTFHGLTRSQVRTPAFQYAEHLKLPHNFNEDTKMAGRDWIDAFLKRNPCISVRKPEVISIQRIAGFNKTEVNKFFHNLEEVMTKSFFTPQCIYNMDETGVTTVQETEKIFASKDQKRVGSLTSWERGKTITVICCMSAAGTFVPPMFIYPRKRHSPQLEKDGPLVENGGSGFASIGIFPLNPHKFNDEDFIVASDFLCIEKFPASITDSGENEVLSRPSTSNSEVIALTSRDDLGQQPSTSNNVSLTDILAQLDLRLEKVKGKGKKRKEKAKLTKMKDIKRIKKAKTNLFKSSSSESSADQQVPYDESGDSDIENTEVPQNTQNQRGHQSLCMICLEEGKPREV
ncbi:hypothetical protein ILUMI_19213 [Ignelater luminosus]|uniref:HTH CENPB-type domain-containing protein n=1 Tax=Ignelater luminosus TaxID=2038154 RepID=A0A8K0CNJ3_IGNLU|nr:hypothetical protein ILUMI_19213 [Ignelater luminosus]